MILDKRLLKLAIIVCFAIASLLFIILGLNIDRYMLISQTHSFYIYDNDGKDYQVSPLAINASHPSLMPAGENIHIFEGIEKDTIITPYGEAVIISPYSSASQSTSWGYAHEFNGKIQKIRYEMKIGLKPAYAISFYGISISKGSLPGQNTIALIDSTMPVLQDEATKNINMPEMIYPGNIVYNIKTYN